MRRLSVPRANAYRGGSPTAAIAKRRLREHADPESAAGALRFFKTAPGDYGAGDRFLGVSAAPLRALARELVTLPIAEVEKLLASAWHEDRSLALLILVLQYKRADGAGRKAIYDLYLRSTARINNWDLVDCSAEYIVGPQLEGRSQGTLTRLAKSASLWERRIAVLATRYYLKQGSFDETLRIATMLVGDPEDLIHKAVGWLLREIGDRDRAVEERFLAAHAATMPRTMLRYAIEKFPEPLRRKYLGMKAKERS